MDEDAGPYVGYPTFDRMKRMAAIAQRNAGGGLMQPEGAPYAPPVKSGAGPGPEQMLGLMSMIPQLAPMAGAIQAVPFATGEKPLKGGLAAIADALPYLLPKGQYFRNVVSPKSRTTNESVPLGYKDTRNADLYYTPDSRFQIEPDVIQLLLHPEGRTVAGPLGGILKPGSELLQAYPELKNMKTTLSRDPAAAKALGWYDPQEGIINAESPVITGGDGMRSVLLHEANHAANHVGGLSAGTNPTWEMEKIVKQLIESGKPIGDSVKNQALENYKSSQGETFSRFSEEMAQLPPKELAQYLQIQRSGHEGLMKALMDVAPENQRYQAWPNNFWDSDHGKQLMLELLQKATPR